MSNYYYLFPGSWLHFITLWASIPIPTDWFHSRPQLLAMRQIHDNQCHRIIFCLRLLSHPKDPSLWSYTELSSAMKTEDKLWTRNGWIERMTAVKAGCCMGESPKAASVPIWTSGLAAIREYMRCRNASGLLCLYVFRFPDPPGCQNNHLFLAINTYQQCLK